MSAAWWKGWDKADRQVALPTGVGLVPTLRTPSKRQVVVAK